MMRPRKGHTYRENESADILAANGYDVEQNPDVPGPKNPDYRISGPGIDGEIYDNYAPTTPRARNIWSGVLTKITTQQTERVVINLGDAATDLDDIRDQFSSYPIEGLKDVIVILPDGSITRL